MKTLVLNISGMSCDSCVQQISHSLSLTPGVTKASVDLMTRSARVEHDEKVCGPDELIDAVRRIGFQVDGFGAVEADDEPSDTRG